MFVLLLKNFLRTRMVMAGLPVLLLAGIISIFIGREHINKQKSNIANIQKHQQEHIRRNVQFFGKETGLLFYYLKFALVNEPHPLNALSIGQRDVNSAIQSVTIRNLENQLYDTDLFNPYSLLAGNLDFSFVLVYLFPLLIIGFTYNLLSEEKEGGTWKLVAVQHHTPNRVILLKLAVRAVTVFTTLALLFVLAALILALPVDKGFWATVSISFSYLLVWFAISFWVTSLQKRSGTNAALLLSAWILLTVICPGAANNYITSKYPVPEALATVVKQRESYHEKWDKDKRVTMEKFYAHYPQFRKYTLPDQQFSWLWYYAMQQMGDDEALRESTNLKEKLWKREKASWLVALFIPTLHTQYQLNTLANAGLGNQLLYLDSTKAFHEKMRLQYYPLIFAGDNAGKTDWRNYNTLSFSENRCIDWIPLLIPLLTTFLIFVSISWIIFRKTQQYN